jgi:Cytochrome c554 and c-prime
MFYKFLILFFSLSINLFGEGIYVGHKACLSCHKEQYSSWIKTSHSKTSGKVASMKLPETFKPDKNTFPLEGKHFLKYSKISDKYFEILFSDNKVKHQLEFEYFLGSGKYGQNYLSNLNQRFYGLKSHYLPSVNDWSLYPNANRISATMKLETPTLRCFQCHSTHLEPDTSMEPYFFNFKEWERRGIERYKDNFILGVGCESCHGPGADHIKYQNENPGQKSGMLIKNPNKFPRDRSLDTCRLCHSGEGNLKKNFYSFRPGDKLEDFITFNKNQLMQESVHSNDHVPLEQSKCFQKSEMTCLTCHDPHKNERNRPKVFSQKCLQCHTESHKTSLSKAQKENCIDCHMPLTPFDIPIETRNNKKASIWMRSHLIKIYPKKNK